jgi:hypothetical protein
VSILFKQIIYIVSFEVKYQRYLFLILNFRAFFEENFFFCKYFYIKLTKNFLEILEAINCKISGRNLNLNFKNYKKNLKFLKC